MLTCSSLTRFIVLFSPSNPSGHSKDGIRHPLSSYAGAPITSFGYTYPVSPFRHMSNGLRLEQRQRSAPRKVERDGIRMSSSSPEVSQLLTG
jgi:hypothetical protein